MATPQTRRRIEVPVALYDEIAHDAAAINIPTQTYAVSLLTRALEMDRLAEQHGPADAGSHLMDAYRARTGRFTIAEQIRNAMTEE